MNFAEMNGEQLQARMDELIAEPAKRSGTRWTTMNWKPASKRWKP